MSIIIALIIFSVVVVVHELGHFWAARRCGIKVEEFAVGMGPKIFSIKKGETEYNLRLFPIGGLCRMLGEDADDYNPRAFNSKPVWARIFVITAGVIMNFILALVVGIICSYTTLYSTTTVALLVDGMPAKEAGLQVGDKIVEANGTKTNIFLDFQFVMEDIGGKPVEVKVIRGGEPRKLSITPKLTDDGYKIGFAPVTKAGFLIKDNIVAEQGLERAEFFESISVGYHSVFFAIKSTYVGLFRLVTLKFSTSEMAGPIGIVSAIGNVYQASAKVSPVAVFEMLMKFIMLLSANLAVVNLLPLPALDGGRLVFLIIEAIRRKPVNPEKEGLVHFVGFVLLMIFGAFIAYNDIMKLLS